MRREERRGVTPRRMAAAKRALERQAERLPLFADQIRENQPSPEERINQMDDGMTWIVGEWRELRANHWRKGRRMYFALPDAMRADVREKWRSCSWPGTGTYFITFVRWYKHHGFVYLDRPEEAIQYDRERLARTIINLRERGGMAQQGRNLEKAVVVGGVLKTRE